MLESTLEKIQAIVDRHAEVEREMSEPEVATDPNAIRRLGQEYSRLQEIVGLAGQHTRVAEELAGAQEMLAGEDDPDLASMAREEVQELEADEVRLTEELELALLPPDVTAEADAIVEIRKGAGGDEAGLFAAELYRMYQRYAEATGWKITLVDINESGIGGISEVIFEVQGQSAFSRLKFESGVHRVQRVPATESQGRVHTSTATVAVLPKPDELELDIKSEDIRIDIYHSGGAGGQNVNKVATAVRMTHLETGLVVTSQKERSQLQNRQHAMGILSARLWDLRLREQQEEIAGDRKSQVGTGDRSEKIRTYNFPQSRITDHRINLTSHNLPRVLEGGLDEFIDALQRDEQARKLAAVGSGD
ncbi:MAG: peptide chain release factor 1 [Chloroflexi bacterium]|nr:peptide chain release factor 1 [Chloroflexota bacterium]MBT4073281.1 peptide chain release factor 1 [Chloroflexota bacterium]MBT4513899.1 peptide chain release factor 1 [Chloroflexota bacterium]MBT5318888.1 peptide chain release factor 1 [Chloroflexota bacterium]MBT6682041.1 peptide chain release factor 1 [Chloroflexota bacterium]